MKSHQSLTVITTLELNEEERDWLHQLTQNPIGVLCEEDEWSRSMREKFFEATLPHT